MDTSVALARVVAKMMTSTSFITLNIGKGELGRKKAEELWNADCGKKEGQKTEIRSQGVKPMRGFGGDGVDGGGLRICITSCRTCTMAASCTSNRPVSFFSSVASFFASSGVPRSASRIFA